MNRLYRRTHGWACGSCLALLLLAVPLTGQPGDADQVPAFGEIVDVRVVNVEVVVTDGKQRVEGLRHEDFRLLVDGQEVPIEYFTEVRDSRAVDLSRAVEPDEPGDVPAAPALEPGAAVGTRYLVFIDDDFSIPPRRNRVLQSLADQSTLLGPDDRMAVVAWDGREVELLSGWTRPGVELEAVFAAAQKRRAYGLQKRNELRNPIFQYTSRLEGREAIGGSPGPGSQVYYRVERAVDAAASALRGFARTPGRMVPSARLRRDVALVLSGGWAVPETSGAPGSELTAERELFRRLVDTANRLGYTLYTVDLVGVEGAAIGRIQYRTLDESNIAAAGKRQSDRVEEDALFHLAVETGGRAFLDGGGVHALEGAIEDVRSYYWLGFSPLWREDDRRHRVKVEVRRKGLKVRSRHSFSDLSRASETTMLFESVHLFDLPLPASHALDVALGEPVPEGSKRVVLPFEIAIPMDLVTVLQTGESQFVARLELRVAATDDRGDHADIPVIPLELESQRMPRDGEVWTYSDTLTLRRRPHRLLVSLVDPASGAILMKRLDFDI